MTVVQLRELARANKVRLPYGVNKAQMVETLFRQLGSGMKPAQAPAEQPDIGLYKPKPLGFYDEEYGTSNPVVPQMLKAGLLGSGHGLLEVQPGGYGFLRAQNGTPGADDIYVSIAQIRRFNLHSGDEIVGKTRPKRMGAARRASSSSTRSTISSSGVTSMPPAFTTLRRNWCRAERSASSSGSSITSLLRMASHISRAVSYWSSTNMAPFRLPTLVPVMICGCQSSSISARHTPT